MTFRFPYYFFSTRNFCAHCNHTITIITGAFVASIKVASTRTCFTTNNINSIIVFFVSLINILIIFKTKWFCICFAGSFRTGRISIVITQTCVASIKIAITTTLITGWCWFTLSTTFSRIFVGSFCFFVTNFGYACDFITITNGTTIFNERCSATTIWNKTRDGTAIFICCCCCDQCPTSIIFSEFGVDDSDNTCARRNQKQYG
mmetsp:Transcript_12736/g.18759  ORF Transcript_12736/g.18759 Transcript_12736/m.18759 type:complete len:204 (+) Transcript_12736:311-922(+)